MSYTTTGDFGLVWAEPDPRGESPASDLPRRVKRREETGDAPASAPVAPAAPSVPRGELSFVRFDDYRCASKLRSGP